VVREEWVIVVNNTLGLFEEYDSSISEMNRRKKAFLTLSISLFISVNTSFFIFFFPYLQLVLPFIVILALFLTFAVLHFNRLLDRSKSIKINISDDKIAKKWFDKNDIYDIKSISSVNIKRTTTNLIREIKIVISGKRPFFINGLDRFEEFNNRLLSSLEKDVKIYKVKEPIDFDHPLFYALLGTFVGISSILFLKVLFIYSNYIWLYQLLVACFSIVVGIYWLFSKPITGRYGLNKKIVDNVMGTLFIIIGFALMVVSKGISF
jgi:hypothetical protein